jgi:hypothetical protein
MARVQRATLPKYFSNVVYSRQIAPGRAIIPIGAKPPSSFPSALMIKPYISKPDKKICIDEGSACF